MPISGTRTSGAGSRPGRRAVRLRPPLLALLLIAAPVAAQQPITFQGMVVDASSAEPVPGAVLALGETGRQAISDEAGRFTFVRAPSGMHLLRAQRYGYLDLEVRVTVSAEMGPLTVRMAPAPILLDELTVTGDARGDVTGIVLDAGSGRPIPFTDVTLTRGAVDRVGRPGATDDDGAFEISNIEVGEYLLRVERIGYHPQYVPVSHAVPALPIEVRLEADSALIRGLAVMNGELTVRRRAHARPALAWDERALRLAPRVGTRQFLEFYSRDRIVRCGDPPVFGCIELRGRSTRPVVYIDGFQVPEPPSTPGMRGIGPPAPNGLEVLQSYNAYELYKVEYFVCAGGIREEPRAGMSGSIPVVGYVEIHAYTREYMERLARDPKVPLPACLP
jgi:hypothetical protein